MLFITWVWLFWRNDQVRNVFLFSIKQMFWNTTLLYEDKKLAWLIHRPMSRNILSNVGSQFSMSDSKRFIGLLGQS